MTYHVQKNGSRPWTFCGRRVGTPGGQIYPGVRAMPTKWFDGHNWPKNVLPSTCKTCLRAAGKEAFLSSFWRRATVEAIPKLSREEEATAEVLREGQVKTVLPLIQSYEANE